MFQRVYDYPAIQTATRWYKPRAYGEPLSDGTWAGWLVFFALNGRSAKAPAGPETTQTSLALLARWAAGLTPVYLEGALKRALGLRAQRPVVAELDDAEYEALEDAELLETSAAIERTAAKVDEAAAITARRDAQQIRRDRMAMEAAEAATEEASAKLEAEAHEHAASLARATAATAKRRRDSLNDKRASSSHRNAGSTRRKISGTNPKKRVTPTKAKKR